MIRVLIVEDEPPIARAVKQMIEGSSDAFEVIGYEMNGQAALLRMEEEPADVVITDIRMPVMNGLELIERLIALYPNCLSVILSGHQDFSYVQSALRLGAFDYILKPLAPDKMADLLTRIEEACVISALQQNRGFSDAGAPRGAGASSNADSWVLLACAGNWPLSPDDGMAPGAAFWKEHSAEKLIRLFMDEGEEVLVLEGKVSTEYVFILKKTSPERAAQISGKLFSAMTRLSPLPKTLYAATEPVAFCETGTLIRAMRSKLYLDIKLCGSMMFTDPCADPESGKASPGIGSAGAAVSSSIGGTGFSAAGGTGFSAAGGTGFTGGGAGFTGGGVGFSGLPVNKVVEALCLGGSGQLEEAIGGAVDMAAANEMTQMAFVQFIDAVISDQRLVSHQASGLKPDLYDVVSNAASIEGLKTGLAQVFGLAGMDESKTDKKTLVLRIERYLKDNYTKGVSNEMLSALFGFVPSYISKIFRAQTGLSPAEYLTQLRIEKAKELLDSRQGLLIREVSILAGYNDPYYFSKAFKKVTGLWPTQYQAESQGHDT